MRCTLHSPRLLVALTALASLAAAVLPGGPSLGEMAVGAQATASMEGAQSPLPVSSKVQLEAVGTERNGITGRPRVSMTFPLVTGQSATRFVTAGRAANASICLPGIGMQPSDEAAVQWRLDVSVVGIADGRTTLRLHWTRGRRGAAGVERDEANEFTLGPDDSHVLDFVESSDPSSSCASLMLRASAQPIVPADARPVVVDLWTVDEANAAAIQPVHSRLEGPSGKLLDYKLDAMEIGPASGERREPLTMDVAGTIAVSPTDDGLLEVDLSTACRTAVGNNSAGGRGRVHVRAKPGETAALLLPAPAGRLSLPSGAGYVDLGRAFDGHQIALYVKVELR